MSVDGTPELSRTSWKTGVAYPHAVSISEGDLSEQHAFRNQISYDRRNIPPLSSRAPQKPCHLVSQNRLLGDTCASVSHTSTRPKSVKAARTVSLNSGTVPQPISHNSVISMAYASIVCSVYLPQVFLYTFACPLSPQSLSAHGY